MVVEVGVGVGVGVEVGVDCEDMFPVIPEQLHAKIYLHETVSSVCRSIHV